VDATRSSSARGLLVTTGLFVAGLALVAGVISFDHMRELAQRHGQLGWRAYAFPVSVDGLEVVASLYLVAQRRAGRPTGWVPWTSLIVGTVASLAANVSVGGDDPIGKALAGWPALSMLASVKLFFGMFDHNADGDRTVDDSRTVQDDLPVVRDDHRSFAGPAADVPERPSENSTNDGDERAVAQLLAATRHAGATLASDGLPLSRDRLADAMRTHGHSVSNAHASLLVKILKRETATADAPG
jgi:hypothetical protein